MKSLLDKIFVLLVAVTVGLASGPVMAQSQADAPPPVDREATGGAQTLEDIMRRQRGEEVAPVERQVGPADLPEGTPGDLSVRGGASDSDLWSAIRRGRGDVITTQARGPNATSLVQNEGEEWLATRNGPVLKYTGWAFAGMVILLALFFTIRGRIRVKGGMSGVKVRRFSFLERFAHWVLAISFIVLAISGFSVLAGREALIPFLDWSHGLIYGADANPNFGQELFTSTFVPWLGIAKPLHNSVSWAFMVALVLIFVLWVFHNIPGWTDIKWLAKGGGIIGNGHPDAKKFNAGQKLIFWSVILLGASVSASGVMLLFPYEVPMFGKTFDAINVVAQKAGQPTDLNTDLSLMQEMQYATLWHTIIATVLSVIILAHIYIGSIGMQGAFSAMGSGKVDLNWAEEHHNLWVEKLRRKGKLTDYEEGVVRTRPVNYNEPAE